MIVLNPFLDSLCNFGFKNIGLTPGIPKRCFQHPQDVVYYLLTIPKEQVPLGRHKVNLIHKKERKDAWTINVDCIT